jgi:solute:Na+ symporter, SSS family
LIGLVLAGMISATSSKANTTINMAATVFAQDIYRNLIRPNAPEKEVIFIARFFTLLFGILTILVAIWIPSAGGIVEVVLSTASIAGGALFAPIIWTLFSKRQTGFSVVTATILSLVINLFFKIISPSLLDIKLNRTMETTLGMGIPILVLAIFEIYYSLNQKVSAKALLMEINSEAKERVHNPAAHIESLKQNRFGVRVIALSMGVVGIGITTLGILADRFGGVVISVGAVILFFSGLILIMQSRKPKLDVPRVVPVEAEL